MRFAVDLAHDPEGISESRSGAERAWFEFPLGVLFDVDAVSKTVRILQV
jgi:hypothetical protein